MVQLLWKIIEWFLTELNRVLLESRCFPPRCILYRTESRDSNRYSTSTAIAAMFIIVTNGNIR